MSRARLPLLLFALVALVLIGVLAWLALSDPPEVRPAAAPPSEPVAESARATREPAADAPEPARPAAVPTSAPPASRSRAVAGRVTNLEDAPIPGVTVRLVPGGSARAEDRVVQTGANGEYRIDDAPPRVARLEFSASGYESRIFDRPAFPEAPLVQWDVQLSPAGGVHGMVLGPDDAPVSGAVLGLWLPDARRVATVGRSDGSGRFVLELPEAPGPYELRARHNNLGEATLRVTGPGEVIVRLPGGGFVSGRVVDTTGDPVQAFALSADPRGRRMMASPVAQSFDSGDGQFRLGPLAAGAYDLAAAADGFQPGSPVAVEVRAGETTADVVLVMKPSGTLQGRVTDARTRQPIEGALVVPAEWRDGDLAESVGAMTDADGRYRLRALPGKRSSLTVSADGYRPLLGGGVVVPAGKSVQRDFSLTPQGRDSVPTTELTGIGAVLETRPDGVALAQIVDGSPAAGALQAGDVVVMVDDRATRGLPLGDVANAIRGEQGTEVTLWVKRGGEGNPERVVLRRGRVSMPERPRRGGHGH